MTHSKTTPEHNKQKTEKEAWEENRDEANSTNIEASSPALKQNALTGTDDRVKKENLSNLDKEDLPKTDLPEKEAAKNADSQ